MNITIVGAGNVATHLAHQCHQNGHTIQQIYSRSIQKAANLAHSLQAQPTNQLDQIYTHSDLYLLAIPDAAIPHTAQILAQYLPPNAILAHTSGATPTTALLPFQHRGILYPLQTFSIAKPVDFRNIPICYEGSTQHTIQLLHALASSLSPHTHLLSDEQRKALHTAAVFVNNFTNCLFAIGKDIADHHNLPFQLLQPLIHETIQKITTLTPLEAQTGPARRADLTTIQSHLQFLAYQPDYQHIYRHLTNQIFQQQQHLHLHI
jgi:predicted short-subunit dehydrogenase-like oxidoreductase (DUF2520 family)